MTVDAQAQLDEIRARAGFIGYAQADLAFLLAEIDKRDAALEAVQEVLANHDGDDAWGTTPLAAQVNSAITAALAGTQ